MQELVMRPAIDKPEGKKALILGPCSAESEEQMITLASEIKGINPDFVRAGLWKPRTRPGSFEGMGSEALSWMNLLQKEYGLKVCTEVGNANHVDMALKAGIDALWLGARTTVNPFYVDEIAKALKGVDIPVMIKNPLNPDIFLWIGGIERIMQSGISRIAAIHRGFSFYGNSVYRNVPRWQIPIELRRRMPGIQLIADISHISGKPEHLLEIAQIAYDLNYDGLMCELHPNPHEALSDADQQVKPKFFEENILHKLVLRQLGTLDESFNTKIGDYRRQIDAIDLKIVKLLSDRMILAEQIGIEKKNERISIFQPDRWDQIVDQLLEEGKKSGLSDEFIFSLLEAIHIESVHHQSRMMNLE